MPIGLTLGANCVITGIPTTPGAYPIVVMVTDSSNSPISTTAPVTITVNPTPKLTLTGSLPNAIVGVPYSQTLQASGGIPPYTYAITAGALPAGLTLSSSGVVSWERRLRRVRAASPFTATDTETTPQTASLPLVLLVVYPTTANDSGAQRTICVPLPGV